MSEQESIPAAGRGTNSLAIASLVLGILSLCGALFWWLGGPLSVIGLALGFPGVKSSAKGTAIGGLLLSGLGLLLVIVFIALNLVLGPVVEQVQDQMLTSTGA
jgi:hypothetical protein